MNNDFLQVSGENLVVNGGKIMLRGFGIGSWMNMEHFMTGLPGNDNQKRKLFAEIYGEENAKEFFDYYLSCFMTEKDFIFLKELGVNVIRLAFTYRHFEDDQRPGEYKIEGFKHIDRVLKLCERYGIYAVLDLHGVPGGQNPAPHADNSVGETVFWEDASLRNRMIGLWAFIAEHYKDNKWIAAYDIINEPAFVSNAKVFNDFYYKAIDAIRKIDSHHVIFIEGDGWAQDFSMLYEMCDPQLAYSFHFYPFYAVGRKFYPERCSKADIENAMLPILKIQDRFHRPVWCGETGSRYPREEIIYQTGLVRDTLEILEKYNVSWTLWAYKDAQSMGLVYPKDSSVWMKFVKEIGWQEEYEKKFTTDVYDFFEKSGYFKQIGELTRFKLKFKFGSIFQDLYIEQLLRPKLERMQWSELKEYPASFLWENCEYHKELADMVMSFTK